MHICVLTGNGDSALSGIVIGVMPHCLQNSPYCHPYQLEETPFCRTQYTQPRAALLPVRGNMVHSQAVSSETQVVVPAGMFLGEGLVPLPAKLVQCIICLEFVEMGDLLPESGWQLRVMMQRSVGMQRWCPSFSSGIGHLIFSGNGLIGCIQRLLLIDFDRPDLRASWCKLVPEVCSHLWK